MGGGGGEAKRAPLSGEFCRLASHAFVVVPGCGENLLGEGFRTGFL